MRSTTQLIMERNAMYQLHPCQVTEKMKQEWETVLRYLFGMLESKDYSITILDMTTGKLILHLPYYVHKLLPGNELTIEALKTFTTVQCLNFLFEAEQLTYEQIMALSPAKRPLFVAKWYLDFNETDRKLVYYQLTIKPQIFDDVGNPWLVFITAQRLPAMHRPKKQRHFTFSHTSIPLKEKKEREIKLTEFHISILELIHDGDSISTIVEKLQSTKGTLKRTLQRIYNNLGVTNGKDAYEVARKLGLLQRRAMEEWRNGGMEE